MEADPQIDVLARRLRWLERHRRKIVIVVAGTFAVFGVVVLPELLGAEWPRVHAQLMALAGAIVLALVIEVGLAALLAVWETRYERMVAAGALPRAELVRR